VSPIEPASPALADAIRILREERSLTQEDVAIDAGITPGSLSRIETARSNPTWTTVERITGALGVSLTALAAAVEANN
jgi:transcriptional regulator with XRE-family HTH domain